MTVVPGIKPFQKIKSCYMMPTRLAVVANGQALCFVTKS